MRKKYAHWYQKRGQYLHSRDRIGLAGRSYSQADRLLARIRQAAPHDGVSAFRHARVLEWSGRNTEARAAYEDALRLGEEALQRGEEAPYVEAARTALGR